MVSHDQWRDAERIRPEDSVEAAQWVADRLGCSVRGATVNASPFTAQLGLHNPGGDREAYYPRFSAQPNDGFGLAMLYDTKLHPPQPPEPEPVPPLRDSWAATFIRTRDEVRAWYFKARQFDAKDWAKKKVIDVGLSLLDRVGYQKPTPAPAVVASALPGDVWSEGPPYDPATYAMVQEDIAAEKAAEAARAAVKAKASRVQVDTSVLGRILSKARNPWG